MRHFIFLQKNKKLEISILEFSCEFLITFELIKSLPDDCTLEDIQYHLYVREKIERGMMDIDAGKTVSQKEAERRVQGWLKSSGQKQD